MLYALHRTVCRWAGLKSLLTGEQADPRASYATAKARYDAAKSRGDTRAMGDALPTVRAALNATLRHEVRG